MVQDKPEIAQENINNLKILQHQDKEPGEDKISQPIIIRITLARVEDRASTRMLEHQQAIDSLMILPTQKVCLSPQKETLLMCLVTLKICHLTISYKCYTCTTNQYSEKISFSNTR